MSHCRLIDRHVDLPPSFAYSEDSVFRSWHVGSLSRAYKLGEDVEIELRIQGLSRATDIYDAWHAGRLPAGLSDKIDKAMMMWGRRAVDERNAN